MGLKQLLAMSLVPMVEGNMEVWNDDYKFGRFQVVGATREEGPRLQWMQFHYYSPSSHSSLLRQQNVPNFV